MAESNGNRWWDGLHVGVKLAAVVLTFAGTTFGGALAGTWAASSRLTKDEDRIGVLEGRYGETLEQVKASEANIAAQHMMLSSQLNDQSEKLDQVIFRQTIVLTYLHLHDPSLPLPLSLKDAPQGQGAALAHK